MKGFGLGNYCNGFIKAASVLAPEDLVKNSAIHSHGFASRFFSSAPTRLMRAKPLLRPRWPRNLRSMDVLQGN